MTSATRKISVFYIFFLFFDSLYGKEVDRLYRSGDFLGRGNAGMTAPAAEDALFYNPASIYKGEEYNDTNKTIFLSPNFVLSDNVQKLSDAGGDDQKLLNTLKDIVGEPVFLSFDSFSGYMTNRWGAGLLLNQHINLLVYKHHDQGGIETVSITGDQNTGIVSSYSQKLDFEGLNIGVTGKVIRRTSTLVDLTIADVDAIKNFDIGKYQNSGMGLGIDLALLYQMPHAINPKFSFVIRDLGDTSFNGEEGKAPVNSMGQTINLGSSIDPQIFFPKTELYLDINDVLKREEDNLLKSIHLGMKIQPFTFLGINFGFNQGYSAASVYYESNYFRMDIGSYGEEVGDYIAERPSRRYFMRISSHLTEDREHTSAPTTETKDSLKEGVEASESQTPVASEEEAIPPKPAPAPTADEVDPK